MSGPSSTSIPFRIREAEPGDVATLVDFNIAMAAETEHRDLDRELLTAGVRAVLEDSTRGRYFVAAEEGTRRIVGALLVTYEWSDWRNGVFWWIQSAYVLVAERRRGVFRALYRFLVHRARSSRNVCGLRLYVEQENERAQAVYQTLGMIRSPYRMFEVDFVFGQGGH